MGCGYCFVLLYNQPLICGICLPCKAFFLERTSQASVTALPLTRTQLVSLPPCLPCAEECDADGFLSLRERDDTDSPEPAVLPPGVPASAHRAEGTGRHPGLPAGLRRRASLCPRLGFSRCVCRTVIVSNCLKLQSVLSKVRPGACGSLTAPGHTLAHAHQRPVQT